MSYVDGFVAAVPDTNKQDYIAHASDASKLFKEFGALACTECWGNDVPDGQVTDFRRAVQARDGESIVLGWITWPDKKTRDDGWARMMSDERMANAEMPFDGKRMIYGGFTTILDV